MRKFIAIVTVLAMMLTLCSCGRSKQKTTVSGSDKKVVYTSFYAMYDFTRTIANGSNIEVTNLVPSGMEPHEWEPTASDIRKLSKADGIICNGDGMEGWMDKIKKSIGDVKTLEASEYIMTINDTGVTDPHVWLSPQNAKMQLNAITEFLCGIDESEADKFKANLSSISEQIDKLDDDFKLMVNASKKRDIIVTHGAYGYLCRAYGIEQTSVEGINGESDPSPEKLSAVARFAADKEIKYVFYTNGEHDKTAETLAKEIEGQSDSLNSFEFDAENRDYITVMRDNMEKLRKALA